MHDPHPQRQRLALYIAVAFHFIGFIAFGLFHAESFIRLTPLNLLICLALVLYTQETLSKGFIVFAVAAFVIGFSAEWVGVHTGRLFGDYAYGDNMGPKWQEVPLLIGVQWLVTTYCAGVAIHMLHERLQRNPNGAYLKMWSWWRKLSLVLDGAMIAVFFDWVMEPVAVHLGYWKWHNGDIPWLNYFSWYGVSALILGLFHVLPFPKKNLFAVHLLLIQLMFFLLLRTTIKLGI